MASVLTREKGIYAPHPFSLRQLQYAVAVADTLSFRKAAERCRVAQPSLSAQLAQLEEAFGVRLFERDRRHVILTAAGKLLVERARRLLAEVEDFTAAARGAADPLAGTLRIGVIPTISPYLMPIIAPELRSAYPRLSLVWIEDKTDRLVRGLESGTLDGALVALEAELGEVESEIIAADPFVLATAAGHPLGSPASAATPGELRGTSVLLLDDGHCLREQALAFCSSSDAHELEFRATSLTTLAQMVAGGAGITLLPALAVPAEAGRADLSVRPFADPAPHRTIALIWRKRSPVGATLRTLAATIRDAYPAEPASIPIVRKAQARSRSGPRRAFPRAPDGRG